MTDAMRSPGGNNVSTKRSLETVSDDGSSFPKKYKPFSFPEENGGASSFNSCRPLDFIGSFGSTSDSSASACVDCGTTPDDGIDGSYSKARKLFETPICELGEQRGVFGANMQIDYLNSIIASLRAELDTTTQRHNHQIQQAHNLNAQLIKGSETVHGENQRLVEENKLLKKVVARQDQKHRDQVTQSQQFEYLLGRAVERIGSLTEENNQMKSFISTRLHAADSSSVYRDSFDHNPPPDVF
jgi:hypothetical protein